ncbi:MAG: right-handed parallel beta-helix repeat-containing protein [Myxococcota bacterium]|nr:right-handed parallel beta-helix repeat-containing protein [Myxococcota bacterium]
MRRIAIAILALLLGSCTSPDVAVDAARPDASEPVRDAASTPDAAIASDASADAEALGPAYYVRPTGDDASAGTSPELAWRTLARVNEADLEPGDRVLLEGGASFDGTLQLDAEDMGTPAAPIVVSAFGEGRATLRAGDARGVVLYNTAGIELSRLDVVGSGRETNAEDGIVAFVDLPGDVKLEHLIIDDVDVSGFGKSGIVIGADNGNSGFRHVRITRARAHDNAVSGITVYGAWSETPTGYAMADVYIGHCVVHDNTGIAGLSHHTGSGIVIGGVDGGVIERSVAYANGRLNTAVGGPIGIWAWDSNDVTIQYNEAYENRTDSSADGGGFDLDGGVTNSVMQYNYSHDNDGAGFLLAQYGGAPRPFANNVVRYNISQNDGRRNGYGGIHFWTAASESASNPVRDVDVYGNTIFVSPSASGSPSALRFQTGTRDVRVHNNLFVTTGGVRLADIASGQTGLLVQGNAYWSSGDDFRIVWRGTSYATLEAWRAATGQEQQGALATGITADPRLTDAGGGATLGDADLLSTLAAYRLQPGSPLIDAGLDLGALLGLPTGVEDYYGTLAPQGAGHDIGAHEAR